MAGCGTSCRRLRGENGVKVEPDCCGGCVVSIDPASLPSGDGITEAKAKEIADAAAKAAVDAYAAKDTNGGITEAKAKEIADAAAKAAIDEYAKNNPGGGITEAKAKEIADAAAKAAIDEYAKNNPGGGETPEGAQAKADKALTDAKAYTDQAKAAAEKCCEKNTGDIKTLNDTYTTHLANCHTRKTITDGVTPEKGWEIEKVELNIVNGVHSAFIRFNRSGDNIESKGADFVDEKGIHNQGNIVPDLLIAKVGEEWQPTETFLENASTAYGSGSVRIHGPGAQAGEVYLVDWTFNAPLQTGHALRFDWTFVKDPKCAAGGGDNPGPGPTPGGVTEDQVKDIVQKAINDRIALYPSGYADNFDNTELRSRDWISLAPEVAVKLKVPPSRKVLVTTCMTSRNTAIREQTYQSVEIKAPDGTVVLEPGDSRSVTISSDQTEEAQSACYALRVDFTKIADGKVKAGDEVTFTVQNRKALDATQNGGGDGVSTVLDRNITVVSIVEADAS
ncbi:hypothetical protein [Streptomyces violaceusniger]|uniref:Uncharacterized protein n=1 Tax=Streptomyces violaceusniger (strain Tu 4113) TaxID=653045 RepID=G2PHJ6_STRV4|nr:hypothetical protein [Streptomyces violaceusniger]AEM88999.1 hypothetical protein Strvi_0226 [Streptomyces violaceusniger Tu 4113]